MKIATSTKGMSAFAGTPEQMVSAFAGTGFRYLDYDFGNVTDEPEHWVLRENWEQEALRIRQTAEKHGLRFVQAHGPGCRMTPESIQREIFIVNRVIAVCGILGISNMAIHAGFFPELKYPHDQQRYCEANIPFFQALIPAMEQHHVYVLIENTTIRHCREGCYYPIYAKDLNTLIAHLKHPLFGAVWDVGHANIDGIDQRKEILELGNNLKAIHVHDNHGICDEHLLPFMGTVNYDSVVQGLIESGYQGYFTLEIKNFFPYRKGVPEGRLQNIDLSLKKETISTMYSVSRYILSAYGIYEE